VLTLTVPNDPGVRDSIYQAMTTASAQARLVIRRSLRIAIPLPVVAPPPPGPIKPNPVQPQPPVRPIPPVHPPIQTMMATQVSRPAPVLLTPQTPQNAQNYREIVTAIDSTIPFTFDPVLDKNIFSQLTGISSASGQLNAVQVSWQGRPYSYYQDPNQPSQIYFLPDSFKISRQHSLPHSPNIIVATNGSDPNSLVFTLSFLAAPVWDPNRLLAATPTLQGLLALSSPPTLSLLEASNAALALTLPPNDAGAAPGLISQPGAVIDTVNGISCSVALTLPQIQQVFAALFDGISQLLSGVVTVTVGSDIEHIPFISSAADFAGDIFDVSTTFDPNAHQFLTTLKNAIESPVRVDSLPAIPIGNVQPSSPDQSSSFGNQLLTTLENTLASSLHINPLPAIPTHNDQPFSIVAEQITPVLPVIVTPESMAPSAAPDSQPATDSTSTPTDPATPPPPSTTAISVTVQLGAKQNVDQSCSVLFDYSHTKVLPDSSAIWDAIVSNQVVGPVKQTVTIKAFASIFNPPAAASGTAASTSSGSADGTTPAAGGTLPATTASTAQTDPLLAVQVIFEDGQTADFDATTPVTSGIMIQTVTLSVPVKAYVLQNADCSVYKYRLNLISNSGERQTDWITPNGDSFYVQVNN